jgi:RHS repeat-associated protein
LIPLVKQGGSELASRGVVQLPSRLTLRTVTFAYDPFGRRVRKQVQGLAPQVPFPLTTNYTYDGEDIVLQLESDGTTATTTKYVHGPGIDEPLAMLRGGASFFYHADGLGSMVAVSDGSKNVVARYGYDAFGMVSASDPAFANTYAYTGREWDKEIGLYYYRARYYDPMEGRFISRDPIGFAGGDVNVYRYVQNNSINLIDPSGNIEPLTALAIIALAKAGAIAIPWATMRATAYFMGDPEVS